MSITAKELAKKLNLSAAAVSMALNGKPGVSTQTRKMIIEEAHNHGFDFSKIKEIKKETGTICFIIFRKHGTIVNDTPFFKTLSDSIAEHCKNQGYKLNTHHLFDYTDINDQLKSMVTSDTMGIILLGTEMQNPDFYPFSNINLPIVLLDSYFSSSKIDSILINNVEGAYEGTNHLIKKYQAQPGYMHSSYSIYNFEERADGYFKGLRLSGMSKSKSIIHLLSPTVEGAYADMKNIIDQKEPLARSYFADNDLIAFGAMKALKEAGYKIPEDIAIIGFDNMPLCTYIEPNLSSINVPIKYMGQIAVNRLIHVCQNKKHYSIKLEVNTNIILRETT